MNNASGRLLMIAAPSGAGKSSLVNAFLERHPDWELSISTTTRAPRPGETHGREYFFTDPQTFLSQIDQGAFLEWAQVHGNYYGTSRSWIEEKLQRATNVILEIDWQGARQIRALFDGQNSSAGSATPADATTTPARMAGTAGRPRVQPISVFVLPPSIEELERRLRARGQDSDDVIRKRLAAAQSEMSHANEFDYVIINQDFSAALSELERIAQGLGGSTSHSLN